MNDSAINNEWWGRVLQVVVLLCCVVALGACKGGGGGGSDASQEEIKEPEPSWDEKKVAFFVEDADGATQLEVSDGVFYLRLECRARATGLYGGTVTGGEFRCQEVDEMKGDLIERSYTICEGTWEQSYGIDASCISGLRFELTGQNRESGEVEGIRILGMSLRVLNADGAGVRSGSVEGVQMVEADGVEMAPPDSGTSFYLRKE